MIAFSIPADHPCLPGHFPGQPIVPGVVLLDRVLAAIEARHGALGPPRMPQVKFMQPLLPEQTAQIELQPIEPQPGDAAAAPPRWRFRVLRDGALIASGEVHAT
jgi:3-hydroxyacyl-[acyl-carrier-protein] dehydratase